MPVNELRDSFGRRVDYMRLSVTDRCNLRCRYCRPFSESCRVSPDEVLSYEEFLRVIRIGIGLGLHNVRLTGGEPLVRKNIAGFVARLAALPGLDDLSMTTNGQLLGKMAARLGSAGLQRVNIGLPSLKPGRYRDITGGRLGVVLDGIDAALSAGLDPVKINVVLLDGCNHDEIEEFLEFMNRRPVHVRFIEYMPSRGGALSLRGVSVQEVSRRLTDLGLLQTPVLGLGPAVQFNLPGTRGTVGLISSLSGDFCCRCNRLRVSSTGQARPCLLSGATLDLRTPLRSNAADADVADLLKSAVRAKPRMGNHNPDLARECMVSIGG